MLFEPTGLKLAVSLCYSIASLPDSDVVSIQQLINTIKYSENIGVNSDSLLERYLQNR